MSLSVFGFLKLKYMWLFYHAQKFQPSVQDPAILSMHSNTGVVNMNVNAEIQSSVPGGVPRVRETGLIDKKQVSECVWVFFSFKISCNNYPFYVRN